MEGRASSHPDRGLGVRAKQGDSEGGEVLDGVFRSAAVSALAAYGLCRRRPGRRGGYGSGQSSYGSGQSSGCGRGEGGRAGSGLSGRQ